MAKISIDCGRRHRWPGGDLSDLPAACASKKFRDALFLGASSAFEKLVENVDMIEVVKLSYNFYGEGPRLEIKVVTIDPLLEGEEPYEKKATAELICRIEETSEEAICTQIVAQFWQCLRDRAEELAQLHKAFPTCAKR